MSLVSVGKVVGRVALDMFVKVPLGILLLLGGLILGISSGVGSFFLLRTIEGNYTGSMVLTGLVLGVNILISLGICIGIAVGYYKFLNYTQYEYESYGSWETVNRFFTWLDEL
jgi:hypothetical protein